jgi:hypothetical protein
MEVAAVVGGVVVVVAAGDDEVVVGTLGEQVLSDPGGDVAAAGDGE